VSAARPPGPTPASAKGAAPAGEAPARAAAAPAAAAPEARGLPATSMSVRTAPGPVAGAATRARPPSSAAPQEDFVSNLGPRLLVAAGGLAVVVFLGFFVRYAWENDWVGPTGRVLSAAVFSLGLLAGGLGLMRREYRPLGQGLAAAGLAGLYVTGFAAHTVYALVPRLAAAAFMVFVTTCGVLLAERLNARLLAGLAWLGGYLAPILLATGQDQALSLFAYLLLLGAGAVWLDRRRPWPETLPLALAGTALLYAGWYVRFFRPERFEVAAFGLVALTALLALGASAKPRPAWMALVGFVAVAGLAALALDADRPEIVLPLCLLLAGAALRASRSLGLVPALVAPLAIGLPLLYWAGAHYHPQAFGIAAAWLATGSLLIALGTPESTEPAWLLPAVALIGGGLGAVGLAGSDRPLALLALLVAQAAIALLVARRWAWAQAVSAGLASLAVLVWHERYFAVERAGEALALALTIAGVYFLITALRGLLLGERLAPAGVATHLVVAALAWVESDRVLSVTAPRLLGPAAVALAAVHLAVALASRTHRDPLRVRVMLALAASFLTIAIPVQLGLHGITLAWSAEALVLLWIGVRQGSLLTRAFGYLVLALAIVRLLVRHLPLHAHAFLPVVNPELGVWLAVIASLAVAHAMTRRLVPPRAALDASAGVLLVPLALGLLFAALTMETQAAFSQMAQRALAARDEAAALGADRLGDLSVSVLWTLFATSLLAAALGLRHRGLFYAGYVLFAVTAGKVVLLDLATLPTLYRMLSFLALGVLLLVGAWLNLRFRARLTAPEDAA
jgi:uncharacterized membrane protein